MKSNAVIFSSLIISIFSCLLMTYYALYELMFSSIFFFVILIIINISIVDTRRLRLCNIVSFSYAVFIGLLLIILHQTQFNTVFDSFGDDERFYNWAIINKSDLFQASYSYYEKVLAVILLIFNKLGFEDSPLLLLPLNWLILSLTITMSYRLTYLITGKYIKSSLLFSIVFLNYTFIQNSVHLYRDIYIAFFILSSMIFLLEKKHKKAYLMSLPIALFRLPNGIINIIILNITMYLRKGKINLFLGVSTTILISLLLILSLNIDIQIGKYSTSTISQYSIDRQNSFSENISQKSGGVAFIKSLPLPLELLAHIPGQVLRPIKVQSIYKPLREKYSDLGLFNHRSFGGLITSLSLIFLVGFYVRGIILMFFIRTYEVKVFTLFFVVLALTIGMLAMQDRTRVILIPLFPTIVAMNYMNCKISKLGKNFLYPLNKIFLSVLMAIAVGSSFI